MLADFQHSFTEQISSKAVVKYPTVPQMRRYITVLNINVRKQQQLATYIMINVTLQRSLPRVIYALWGVWLLYYKFTAESVSKELL